MSCHRPLRDSRRRRLWCVPTVGQPEEFEIVDDFEPGDESDSDSSDDDSGWRNLLASRQNEPSDDVVIELD